MCKSMSNTPFQVYLINKFIEQIMNKKFEKNAHSHYAAITALEFLKIIQVI
jgi:hypothetical protein